MKFGYAYFDGDGVHAEIAGKTILKPCLYSVGGGEVVTCEKIDNLPNDVLFLSNLSRNVIWKSGAVRRAPLLKPFTFIKFNASAIERAFFGDKIASIEVQKRVRVLSLITSQFFKEILKELPEESINYQYSDFFNTIKDGILIKEKKVDRYVDEILLKNHKEHIFVKKEEGDGLETEQEDDVVTGTTKTKIITVGFDTVKYAKLFDKAIVPLLEEEPFYTFYDAHDIEKKKLLETTLSGRFIIKASDIRFKKEYIKDIIEPIAQSGWWTDVEYYYLKEFTTFNIEGLFLFDKTKLAEEYYKKHHFYDYKIASENKANELLNKIVQSLLVQNIFSSLLMRTFSENNKKDSITTTSVWMSAIDKMLCVNAAILLKQIGTEVMMCGLGELRVSVPLNKLRLLNLVCAKLSLKRI